MTGRLGAGCISRMMSSARGCSLAIPQLRSARSAAPFLPQRSLLTAARARQAAADWSSGTASGLPSLASSARKALSCGLFTADLSRKGTRIVAGSARKSWTTLISAAPPISSAGATRVEKAASTLIPEAVCSSVHVWEGRERVERKRRASNAQDNVDKGRINISKGSVDRTRSCDSAGRISIRISTTGPPDTAAPSAASPGTEPPDAEPPDTDLVFQTRSRQSLAYYLRQELRDLGQERQQEPAGSQQRP